MNGSCVEGTESTRIQELLISANYALILHTACIFLLCFLPSLLNSFRVQIQKILQFVTLSSGLIGIFLRLLSMHKIIIESKACNLFFFSPKNNHMDQNRSNKIKSIVSQVKLICKKFKVEISAFGILFLFQFDIQQLIFSKLLLAIWGTQNLQVPIDQTLISIEKECRFQQTALLYLSQCLYQVKTHKIKRSESNEDVGKGHQEQLNIRNRISSFRIIYAFRQQYTIIKKLEEGKLNLKECQRNSSRQNVDPSESSIWTTSQKFLHTAIEKLPNCQYTKTQIQKQWVPLRLPQGSNTKTVASVLQTEQSPRLYIFLSTSTFSSFSKSTVSSFRLTVLVQM